MSPAQNSLTNAESWPKTPFISSETLKCFFFFVCVCVYCGKYRFIGYSDMYVYLYVYTYIHTYIHTYIYTYIHIYIHTYIHTYIHIYIHTRTYIYIYEALTCHLVIDGYHSLLRLVKQRTVDPC